MKQLEQAIETFPITPIEALSSQLKSAEKNMRISFPDSNTLFKFILSPEAPTGAWGIAVPKNFQSPEDRAAVKQYSIAEAKSHFYQEYKDLLLNQYDEKSWKGLKPLFQHESAAQANRSWEKFVEKTKTSPIEKQKYEDRIVQIKTRLSEKFPDQVKSVKDEDLTKIAEGKYKTSFLRRSQSSIETRIAKKVDRKIKIVLNSEGGYRKTRGLMDRLISIHGGIKHGASKHVSPGISREDGRFFLTAHSLVETWKGARWISPLMVEEQSISLSRKERAENPVGVVVMLMKNDLATGETLVDVNLLEQPGTFVQGHPALGPAGQSSKSNYEKADIIGGPNANGKPTVDILMCTALSRKKKDRAKVNGMIHLISDVGNPGRLATNVLGAVIDVDVALNSPDFDETQKNQLRNRKFYRLSELTALVDSPAINGESPIASSFLQELLRKVWQLRAEKSV